jgi:hypothetical protein
MFKHIHKINIYTSKFIKLICTHYRVYLFCIFVLIYYVFEKYIMLQGPTIT